MWIQGLFHPRIPQIHESRDVVDEVSSVFELMAIGSEGRNACKNIIMNKNGRSPVNSTHLQGKWLALDVPGGVGRQSGVLALQVGIGVHGVVVRHDGVLCHDGVGIQD